MIEEFGSYHKLFWNCQMFAKCYLRVITGDYNAKFDHWTLADASRLFLCAFLVGAPPATTIKVRGDTREKRLVNKIASIPANLPPDDASAQASSALYQALKQDPLWGRDEEALVDGPGVFNRIFYLKSVIEMPGSVRVSESESMLYISDLQ
jgi:hypothetical protein